MLSYGSKHTSCCFNILTRFRSITFFEICKWRRSRKLGDIMKRCTKTCIQIHNKSCNRTRWTRHARCRICLLLNYCHLSTIAIPYRWNAWWNCWCAAVISTWRLKWKKREWYLFMEGKGFYNFDECIHTIAGWWRIGGGGAGFRCGGSGGAQLFVLTCGLRSFVNDKLLALPRSVWNGSIAILVYCMKFIGVGARRA